MRKPSSARITAHVAAPLSRLLLALALATGIAACQQPSPSQQVADRFMQLYYGQADAAQAVKLTTGSARVKLERELQAIAGVAPDAGDDRPEVTFKLLSSAAAPASAAYVYQVVPQTSGVGSLTATLELVPESGSWFVSSLSEKHAAP